MTSYAVLFFMLLASASFAVSLGYWIAAARAKTGERFIYCQLAAVGHTGWGIVYMATTAVILIVHAVASL